MDKLVPFGKQTLQLLKMFAVGWIRSVKFVFADTFNLFKRTESVRFICF